MRISKRIREIEKMIPTGSIVADIGCDHAYLDVLAVKNKRALKSYACEVAVGPLERAKNTIHLYHCEDQVIPILSNGLERVPNDANVCVIAGMGFETMRTILSDHDLSQFSMMILQPNCDVDLLRRWLIEHDWFITDEKMVHEGHYYTILAAMKGNDEYSEEDYVFGKFLHDETFKEYWMFRKERIEQILPQLNDEKLIKEFSHLLQMIENKL